MGISAPGSKIKQIIRGSIIRTQGTTDTQDFTIPAIDISRSELRVSSQRGNQDYAHGISANVYLLNSTTIRTTQNYYGSAMQWIEYEITEYF